jgi:hypothetical protein
MIKSKSVGVKSPLSDNVKRKSKAIFKNHLQNCISSSDGVKMPGLVIRLL